MSSNEWHDNCPKNHGEYQGDECPSCADGLHTFPEADGAKFPEFGLEVEVWMGTDGAVVVQIDGAHESDPDCEHLRVYLNEARARHWEAA